MDMKVMSKECNTCGNELTYVEICLYNGACERCWERLLRQEGNEGRSGESITDRTDRTDGLG